MLPRLFCPSEKCTARVPTPFTVPLTEQWDEHSKVTLHWYALQNTISANCSPDCDTNLALCTICRRHFLSPPSAMLCRGCKWTETRPVCGTDAMEALWIQTSINEDAYVCRKVSEYNRLNARLRSADEPLSKKRRLNPTDSDDDQDANEMEIEGDEERLREVRDVIRAQLERVCDRVPFIRDRHLFFYPKSTLYSPTDLHMLQRLYPSDAKAQCNIDALDRLYALVPDIVASKERLRHIENSFISLPCVPSQFMELTKAALARRLQQARQRHGTMIDQHLPLLGALNSMVQAASKRDDNDTVADDGRFEVISELQSPSVLFQLRNGHCQMKRFEGESTKQQKLVLLRAIISSLAQLFC